MMKQTHKQKVKLARRMRTNREILNKVNLFDSAEWNKRKEARIKRAKKQRTKKKIADKTIYEKKRK